METPTIDSSTDYIYIGSYKYYERVFDENGELTYAKFADPSNYMHVVFYQHGLVEQETIYSEDGKLYRYKEYHLVFDGVWTSVLKTEANYNSAGQLVSQTEWPDPNDLNTYFKTTLSATSDMIFFYIRTGYTNGNEVLLEEYDPDGNLSRKIEQTFFENGQEKMVSIYDSNNMLVGQSEYDTLGNCIMHADWQGNSFFVIRNGQISSVSEYNDDKNTLLSYQEYYNNGSIAYRCNFDTDGNETTWQRYSPEGVILAGIIVGDNYRIDYADGYAQKETKYYENGNIQQYAEYYPNGNESLWIVYRENGTIIERNDYREDGSLVAYTSYTENGTIASQYTTNSEGQYYNGIVVRGDYHLEYQDGILVSQTCYFDNGKIAIQREYYSNGNTARYFRYLEDGTLYSWYEKDENGKIIHGFYRKTTFGTLDEQGSYVEEGGCFESYSNGFLTGEIYQYFDGSIKKASYFTYDYDSGLLLRKQHCEKDVVVWDHNFTYNDSGLLILETYTSKNKNWECNYTYTESGLLLTANKLFTTGEFDNYTYHYSGNDELSNYTLYQRRDDGTPLYTTCEYNAAGEKLTSITRLGSGKIVEEAEYDGEGHLLMLHKHQYKYVNSEGIECGYAGYLWESYTYYDNGMLKITTHYNKDGSVSSTSEHFYDDNGKLAEDIVTNSNKCWTHYKYDESGNTIFIDYYDDANGTYSHGYRYVYNEQNHLIEETYIWSDGHYAVYVYDTPKIWGAVYEGTRTVYSYDTNDRLVKESYQESIGIFYETKYWYEYVYDDAGNLIDKVYHE